MKKLFIFMILISTLFANPWCPVSGEKISEHLSTSYKAKLQANDTVRVYSSIYGLVTDMQNYGVYDIKKYDMHSKRYLHVEESELKKSLEEAKKNLHVKIKLQTEVYKKRAYPMGEKVYEKRCPKDIDLEEFLEINELKEELAKRCDIKKENYLQATALYLWDVKREGGIVAQQSKIHVDENEKCPVCGMFIYKYPRWAAQIFYKHGEHEHHFSFDGVKDLMKFYFDSAKWGDYKSSTIKNITKIAVTDYYSQKAVNGKVAFYVIGSDIYGPMGHELIPFESLADAKIFKDDHKGKKIIKFEDIKESDVYKLDTN